MIPIRITKKIISDRLLFNVVYIWFVTCGIVLFEPAPFDIMFMPIMVWALLYYQLVASRRIGFVWLSVLGFALVNILSIFEAEDVERAIFYVIITYYMLSFAAFISILVYNYGYPIIHTIMSGYMLIALLSAVIGIMAVLGFLPFGLEDNVTSFGTRARAFFKDPNVYAPFLLLAFTYGLYKFIYEKSNKLAAVLAIGLLSLGILVSFSRGAWIATLFSMVGYFALTAIVEKRFSQLFIRILFLMGFAVGAALVILVFANDTQIGDLMQERSTLQPYDDVRFLVQQLEFEEGFKHLFGIGPGQSEVFFAKYDGSAFSLYVRAIGEQGIFGGLFLVSIVFFTGTKAIGLCLNGDKLHSGLNCAFTIAYFAILLDSFVVDTIHWRHLFLIIGIIWGLAARSESAAQARGFWSQKIPAYH